MADQKFNTNSLIGLVIALILIGILLPIGINEIAGASFDVGVDATIVTLVTVIVPIMAVVGIVLSMIPGKKS